VQHTNLAHVTALTERALAQTTPLPDTIVWPETLLTTPLERAPGLEAELRRFVDTIGIPIVLGVTRTSEPARNDRYRNVAEWREPRAGVVAQVEKYSAVPIVEAGTFLGIDLGGLNVGAGSGPRVQLGARASDPGRGYGLALCYEVIFPWLVAARTPAGARAVLNPSNDSWLASEAVSRQQIAVGAFRAIETRLPLLRVAHGGISAVIDPLGRIEQTLPLASEGWLVADLPSPTLAPWSEKAALLALPTVSGLLAWALLGGLFGRKPWRTQ
jgi:apolipoprotein N-acyltransferase